MHDVLVFIFHLDTHLAAFVAAYGFWVYGLLFAIVFAETGLVITRFCRATRCCSPAGHSQQRAFWTSGSSLRCSLSRLFWATRRTTPSGTSSARAYFAPRMSVACGTG